jgi:hypothetical protein
VPGSLYAGSVIDQFSQKRTLRIRLPGDRCAFSFGPLGLGCADRLSVQGRRSPDRPRWLESRRALIARINILRVQRNGRGSRLSGRDALPNGQVSTHSRYGLRNNRRREYSKGGRRLRLSPSLDNHPRNTDHHRRMHRRSTVRTPGRHWRCNSLRILPSPALRKLKRIAEPSISLVFSYTGYSDSRADSRPPGDIQAPSFGSHLRPRPDRAWHQPPLRSQRCLRRPRGYRAVRTLRRCPRRF